MNIRAAEIWKMMECIAIVAFGKATKNGEMIVAHSRDESFGTHAE